MSLSNFVHLITNIYKNPIATPLCLPQVINCILLLKFSVVNRCIALINVDLQQSKKIQSQSYELHSVATNYILSHKSRIMIIVAYEYSCKSERVFSTFEIMSFQTKIIISKVFIKDIFRLNISWVKVEGQFGHVFYALRLKMFSVVY